MLCLIGVVGGFDCDFLVWFCGGVLWVGHYVCCALSLELGFGFGCFVVMYGFSVYLFGLLFCGGGCWLCAVVCWFMLIVAFSSSFVLCCESVWLWFDCWCLYRWFGVFVYSVAFVKFGWFVYLWF